MHGENGHFNKSIAEPRHRWSMRWRNEDSKESRRILEIRKELERKQLAELEFLRGEVARLKSALFNKKLKSIQ